MLALKEQLPTAMQALGVLDTGIAIVGARDVNALAFQSARGDSGPTIIEGRAVTADDEVVLGAGTATELDVGVGDVVSVRGRAQRHRLRVVGLAALPVLDDRSGVDIGAVDAGGLRAGQRGCECQAGENGKGDVPLAFHMGSGRGGRIISPICLGRFPDSPSQPA